MDEAAVTRLAKQITIGIQPSVAQPDGRFYNVLLNDQDVTGEIRSPDVDANVSQVSQYAGVRQEMVQRQRAFGQNGRVVMVGRDIGTVVLPDAPLKFYITASPAERANRRWLERSKRGHHDSYEAILADVIRRDGIDSRRQHSPLRPAADAIIVDTTGKVPQAILHELIAFVTIPREKA
jgi:cytidylate kinase